MRFVCDQCEKIVTVNDDTCGETVVCGHCGGKTKVPLDRYEPNAVISDFRIVELVGRGRSGAVYLAEQLSLNRRVALRVLRGTPSSDSDLVVGLVREARAASRLFHSNVAQSIAVGEDDGVWFQAMEYVDGQTLEQLVAERGPLPVDEALSILQQAAEALAFAWEHHQLVYRSFNPLSLMLDALGCVKLVDFSAAYVAGNLPEQEAEKLVITPYTCPEDVQGQEVDIRSDIYSLGATIYFVLTARPPYDPELEPAELGDLICNTLPPSVSELQSDVPELISNLLMTMMAKDPDHRPSDVSDLLGKLGAVQTALR